MRKLKVESYKVEREEGRGGKAWLSKRQPYKMVIINSYIKKRA